MQLGKNFLVILLFFSIQSFVFASYYEFNGQKFKLFPYMDSEPKDLIKDNSIHAFASTIDLKSWQTPVKNQGNRGSCAYFSATALFESLIKMKINQDVNVSEEYLIYYGKDRLGESSGQDASSAYSNLGIFQYGFMLEKDVPYQPSWFEKGLPCEQFQQNHQNTPVYCYAHRRPSDNMMSKKIEIEGIRRISLISTSSEIIKAINNYQRAVLVSLPVHHRGWDAQTGYSYFDEEMRLECQQFPERCGGHSVLIVGYDLNRQEFYFKNSWGYGWGRDGYGTMPFNFIDRYSRREAATALLDGEVYIPEDHNEVPQPVLDNINFDVLNDAKIQVVLKGVVRGVSNKAFYSSLFIGLPENDNLPISDSNVEWVLGYNGVTVRGPYAVLVDQLGTLDLYLKPAVMSIPLNTVNVSQLNGRDVYLRISAYVFDDIEGWNQLFRSWKFVHLGSK